MTTRERADLLKLKGNQCFQKGKFNAAIDMYTEAIVRHARRLARPPLPLYSLIFNDEPPRTRSPSRDAQVLIPSQSTYYSNRALCHSKVRLEPRVCAVALILELSVLITTADSHSWSTGRRAEMTACKRSRATR